MKISVIFPFDSDDIIDIYLDTIRARLDKKEALDLFNQVDNILHKENTRNDLLKRIKKLESKIDEIQVILNTKDD